MSVAERRRRPPGRPRSTAPARRPCRRPGGPGGRDDARRLHLGRRRPQAAARADREGELERARPPGRDRGRVVPARLGAKRHRVLRWPVVRGVVALVESLNDRLQGARHLRQRAAARGEEEISGGDVGRHDRRRARCFAVGLFFVVPVALDQPDQGPARLRLRCSGSSRASLRTAIFLGYLCAALAPARPAPRVRVPRRRAQGDLLLRGRRAARARERRSASRGCTRAAGPASC